MARKRMSRRELVQKDEITTTLERATGYLVEHRKPLLTGVTVLAAVVILVVGWTVYAASRDANAQNALSGVIRIYNDTAGYASDQDRFQAVIEEARQVREDYPNTRAAGIAEYYTALSQRGLGASDEAIESLRGLVDSGDEMMQDLARFALAETYKDAGNLEGAIAMYTELESSGRYAGDALLYELGGLHEAISKPEEARSYYETLMAEYPQSPFRPATERALRRLGGTNSTSES